GEAQPLMDTKENELRRELREFTRIQVAPKEFAPIRVIRVKTFRHWRPFVSFPDFLVLLLLPFTAPAAERVDLTRLQCGNLIYDGAKSSVCYADKFLSDVAQQTNLKVAKNFLPP